MYPQTIPTWNKIEGHTKEEDFVVDGKETFDGSIESNEYKIY